MKYFLSSLLSLAKLSQVHHIDELFIICRGKARKTLDARQDL